MARDWEKTFSSWTKPASDSEEQQYNRTRERIEGVLRANSRLADRDFKVYPKGSYPNYTNVVADSDVDIAVELEESYGVSMEGEAGRIGLTLQDVGGTPYLGDYGLKEFKDDVEAGLREEFGSRVERGDKAIHIAETSTQLPADVVPCRTHKTWMGAGSRPIVGVELRSDKRPMREIHNYPVQHLEEGKVKNRATQRRYKSSVRILKRLENEMVDRTGMDAVPSFLIESAVFSVPSPVFHASSNWTSRVRNVLVHIYDGTKDESCVGSGDWMEANAIKYLFHSNQSWTHEQINSFVFSAYHYVGYS